MPRVTMYRNGRDSKGTGGDIKKYQEGWLGQLNGCYPQKKIEVFLWGVWQWTSDGHNGLNDERHHGGCVRHQEEPQIHTR